MLMLYFCLFSAAATPLLPLLMIFADAAASFLHAAFAILLFFFHAPLRYLRHTLFFYAFRLFAALMMPDISRECRVIIDYGSAACIYEMLLLPILPAPLCCLRVMSLSLMRDAFYA